MYLLKRHHRNAGVSPKAKSGDCLVQKDEWKKNRLRWDPKTIRRVSICHGNIMEYDHVDITNDMGFGWIWDYLYIYISINYNKLQWQRR